MRKNKILIMVSLLSSSLFFVFFQNFTTNTQVRGYIDDFSRQKNGSYLIKGWACQTGSDELITIQIAFGVTEKTLSLFKEIKTNVTNKSSTNQICGGAHYFSVLLSPDEALSYAGKKLYIKGVSLDRKANFTIARSGFFPSLPYSVSCDQWDGSVRSNMVLPPDCEIHKQVIFYGPNLTLDCNNSTIAGEQPTVINTDTRGQGIGGYSAKTDCENSDSSDYFPDPDTSGATVKNCRVRNFKYGVYFNRRIWKKKKVTSNVLAGNACAQLAESHPADPAFDMDIYLGKKYPENQYPRETYSDDSSNEDRLSHYYFNPKNITLKHLVVAKSGEAKPGEVKSSDNGIYIHEYAQNFIIDDTIVTDNGTGIYIERESRGNKIINSKIFGNHGAGIAVDSSEWNTIDNNLIENNANAGISLYKNCGEQNATPRYQGANNNTIQNNVIRGHKTGKGLETLTTLRFSNPSSQWNKKGVGIWIAARQGLTKVEMAKAMIAQKHPGLAARPCVEAEVFFEGHSYYRDYASNNTIMNNTFQDNELAQVIVEDDNNKIINNKFSTPTIMQTGADVIVGSVFKMMTAKFGIVDSVEGNILDVVKGNEVTGNRTKSNAKLNNFISPFGSQPENSFSDNVKLILKN